MIYYFPGSFRLLWLSTQIPEVLDPVTRACDSMVNCVGGSHGRRLLTSWQPGSNEREIPSKASAHAPNFLPLGLMILPLPNSVKGCNKATSLGETDICDLNHCIPSHLPTTLQMLLSSLLPPGNTDGPHTRHCTYLYLFVLRSPPLPPASL